MLSFPVKSLAPLASDARVAGRSQVWLRFLTALLRALAVGAA